MNDVGNIVPMYYVTDAIKFICDRSELSEEVVSQVLDLEMDYMRSIGIVIEEKEKSK